MKFENDPSATVKGKMGMCVYNSKSRSQETSWRLLAGEDGPLDEGHHRTSHQLLDSNVFLKIKVTELTAGLNIRIRKK